MRGETEMAEEKFDRNARIIEMRKRRGRNRMSYRQIAEVEDISHVRVSQIVHREYLRRVKESIKEKNQGLLDDQ